MIFSLFIRDCDKIYLGDYMDSNKDIFINEAFDLALKRYIDYKEKRNYLYASDFLVYVVIVLIYIYDDADIINPYKTKEEKVWENNLLKYGLSKKNVDKLIDDLSNYYKTDLINKDNKYKDKNPFFSYIQEDLIDAFIQKYKAEKMGNVELDNFKKLLFLPDSSSQFQRDMNKIMAVNEDEVDNYYKAKIYELNNVLSFDLVKRTLLAPEVYKAFNLDNDKIDSLSKEDLNLINKRIINYFKMSPIEPNLNEKLIKEVRKMHNFTSNMGSISVILFLLLLVIVILIGLYIGYRMVG